MKIVCPSCAAAYEVPDSVRLSKRAVRCARCGADWVPGNDEAAAPDVAAPHPAAPVIDAPAAAPPAASVNIADVEQDDFVFERPVFARPLTMQDTPPDVAPAPAAPWPGPPRAAPPVSAFDDAVEEKQPLTGWVVSLALLVGLAAASIVFREPIMKAWPASTRAYAALGLYQP